MVDKFRGLRVCLHRIQRLVLPLKAPACWICLAGMMGVSLMTVYARFCLRLSVSRQPQTQALWSPTSRWAFHKVACADNARIPRHPHAVGCAARVVHQVRGCTPCGRLAAGRRQVGEHLAVMTSRCCGGALQPLLARGCTYWPAICLLFADTSGTATCGVAITPQSCQPPPIYLPGGFVWNS